MLKCWQLLVHKALGLLQVEPNDRVADLFCGLGNFTLPLATQAKSVLGIEGSEALVARSRENAAHNGVADRTRFVQKTELWVVAASGGTPVAVTRDFDEDGKNAVWNATSDSLLFHAAIGASSVCARVARTGGRVTLGQAIAVSGAAASPNMGYNTSALVSFLLTMFNVRLGWWFPNPGRKRWSQKRMPVFGFGYLLAELFGVADEKRNYVNVSDGGHFENLAIYELIRRRVRVIIASDGECDPDMQFGSLGNLIRICETDFGAKIDIDVSSIRKQADGKSRALTCGACGAQ